MWFGFKFGLGNVPLVFEQQKMSHKRFDLGQNNHVFTCPLMFPMLFYPVIAYFPIG